MVCVSVHYRVGNHLITGDSFTHRLVQVHVRGKQLLIYYDILTFTATIVITHGFYFL